MYSCLLKGVIILYLSPMKIKSKNPSSIYSWSIQPLSVLHSGLKCECVTLESMICRSVTRLNLVTCIYLFLETDYSQPFHINQCHQLSEYLAMIKLILPWILLPFPFALILSSLCYMWFKSVIIWIQIWEMS